MHTKILNCFYYDNELYIRIIPSKRMFNSTMVHDVVNRGSVFAMRIADQQFTVIPGTAKVTHCNIEINTPLSLTPVQVSMFGDPDLV